MKVRYPTPDGFDDLLLQSDGEVLTGVSFVSVGDVKMLTGYGGGIKNKIALLQLEKSFYSTESVFMFAT